MLIVLVPQVVTAGISIVEENDAFAASKSDRRYTQGLDIFYTGTPEVTSNRAVRVDWGFRNLMYTPENIKDPDPQPWDRPWAGMSAIVYSRWIEQKDSCSRIDLMIGVTGPKSQSEFFQTFVHELIGSPKPMGWDNQIPGELVLNAAWQTWEPLRQWGEKPGLGADLSANYGTSLGTAFCNVFGGLESRAGWNVPASRVGVIRPTAVQDNFYAYVFASGSLKAVMHNVTLGGSFFHTGPSQDLEMFVTEARVGWTVGWKNLFWGNGVEFSYSLNRRSEEFTIQDGPSDWGSISLGIGRFL